MIDPSITGRANVLRALDDLERREWNDRMDAYAHPFIYEAMVSRRETLPHRDRVNWTYPACEHRGDTGQRYATPCMICQEWA